MDSSQRWQVDAAAAGERVDRGLARHCGEPRNRVQGWIDEQRVLLNGRPAKSSTRLNAGDVVAWQPPERSFATALVAEPGELEVLFEDPHVVVLNKPAGLAVHPGAGREQGTLANHLLHRYPEIATVGGPGRPGIVHRLDLDTTGVLVIARSDAAYLRLSENFAARRVGKTYLAIVYGHPAAAQGEIDLAIDRHPRDRKRMAVVSRGRPALTRYAVRRGAAGIALLEIDLATGRTHQIRVHCKAIGHPLIGDPVYGETRWRGLPGPRQRPLASFSRPALHAWKLAFDHPQRGERLRFEAPIPEDLRQLWTAVTGEDWPGQRLWAQKNSIKGL